MAENIIEDVSSCLKGTLFLHFSRIKSYFSAILFGHVAEKLYFCTRKTQKARHGEVLEWLKRHAWKACDRQNWFASSNLALSARLI